MGETIMGRWVPTEFRERVDPRTTALLLVDLQNDFVADGGEHQRRGYDIARSKAVLASCARLLASARSVGTMVIFTQFVQRKDTSYASPLWIARVMKETGGEIPERTLEGTWGAEIAREVEPLPHELVLKKARGSAFIGTSLDFIVHTNSISNLIVVGVVTGGCVEATVRDAVQRDFFVSVPEDCVADYDLERHGDAMKAFRRILLEGDVTLSEEILRTWTGLPNPEGHE